MAALNQSLGQRVRTLREQRDVSVRTLAQSAGVDATWLSRVEHDKYQQPDARLLSRLADALGADVAEFFSAAGYSRPPQLPNFTGYLRARYDLPEEAIAQLQAHFDLINNKYTSEKGDDHGDHLE
jgi:transcriptional regulator with XRE-family HTH domain